MPFSDIAKKNMLARSSNSINKVGSALYSSNPSAYKNFEVTDCITFVLNVLKETYIEMGDALTASGLSKQGVANRGGGDKFYGDLLSRYLVLKQNWLGIYLTQDQFHPSDANQEHTFATAMVKKTCLYTNVPVSFTVLNYNPTKKTSSSFGKLYPYYGESKLNNIDLAALRHIKFGFGISRGGDHTWLYSEGSVYEVHWNSVGSGLYEKRDITKFPWESSLLVVPPDAKASLAMSSILCANP